MAGRSGALVPSSFFIAWVWGMGMGLFVLVCVVLCIVGHSGRVPSALTCCRVIVPGEMWPGLFGLKWGNVSGLLVCVLGVCAGECMGMGVGVWVGGYGGYVKIRNKIWFALCLMLYLHNK